MGVAATTATHPAVSSRGDCVAGTGAWWALGLGTLRHGVQRADDRSADRISMARCERDAGLWAWYLTLAVVDGPARQPYAGQPANASAANAGGFDGAGLRPARPLPRSDGCYARLAGCRLHYAGALTGLQR